MTQQHPGTKVYNCDLYSNWFSLESAWKQIQKLGEYLDKIGEHHSKQGIIVLGNKKTANVNCQEIENCVCPLTGYSQGGLLARATIQAMPKHNVRIFISLSSPQAGQFGSESIPHQFAIICLFIWHLLYVGVS